MYRMYFSLVARKVSPVCMTSEGFVFCVLATVAPPDDGTSMGAIIAAVVCSVFVIVFIIAVFFVRRRMQNKDPDLCPYPGATTPRNSFSRQKKRLESSMEIYLVVQS